MILTARLDIELATATNYLPMGWWDEKVKYQITDLGVPVVKFKDGTSAGFSAYALKVEEVILSGTPPKGTPPLAAPHEWKLVPTDSFRYMVGAYIERLQFEAAEGGGFFLKDGVFWSKKGTSGGAVVDYQEQPDFEPLIAIDGNKGEAYFAGLKVVFKKDGSGSLAGTNITWNKHGALKVTGSVASPFTDIGSIIGYWGSSSWFENVNFVPENIIYEGSTGMAFVTSLPSNSLANGQTVRIFNSHSRGTLSLETSPTPRKIFDNGSFVDTLYIEAGNAVELMCQCSANGSFISWTVTNKFKCPRNY